MHECKKCGLKKASNAFRPGRHVCKQCVKTELKAWRAANADRVKSKRAEWEARNPGYYIARYAALSERAIAATRKWRAKNRDLARSSVREYKKANREKLKEYYRKYYAADPEARKQSQRKWRAKNIDKARRGPQRYRARKAGAPGTHTVAEWRELVRKYRGRCVCCNEHFGLRGLTEDHVVPLSLGGSDLIENIQPLCGPCNSRKGNRHIADYRT